MTDPLTHKQLSVGLTLAAIGAIASLWIVFSLFDGFLAVKGSYLVIALILTAVAYASSQYESKQRLFESDVPLWPVVVVGLAIGIFESVFLQQRVFAVLMTPVALLSVFLQIGRRDGDLFVLTQIVGAYLLTTVPKYFATGFYFGRGDILAHTGRVEALLNAHSAAGMSSYQIFPGYHLLTGSVSLIGSVPPYDSIQLVGITVYGALLLAVFCLIRNFARSEIALVSTFVASFLPGYISFANYFYPQAFATSIFVFVILLGVLDTGSLSPRAIGLSFILCAGALVSHHLSFVLFVPIFLMLTFGHRQQATIRTAAFWIGLLAAAAYWAFQERFYTNLAFFFGRSIQLGSERATSPGGNTHIYGLTVPESSIGLALRSLLASDGIFYIALAAVTLIGLTSVIELPSRYRRAFPLVALGTLGSVVIIKSPISLLLPGRVAAPFVIFFAVVVAIGLYRLRAARAVFPGNEAVRGTLIVMLLATAPVVAADDVYSLHKGPEFFEARPLPPAEVDLPPDEMNQLRAVSDFSRDYGMSLAAPWVTETALELRYGSPPVEDVSIKRDQVLLGDGSGLVYRDRWGDHRVTFFEEDGIHRLALNREVLETTVASNEQIYDAGDVGVLAQDREGTVKIANRSCVAHC
ncbi:hypothetical protein ACOZ4F_12735 [Haloarcula marismortui]|uniref:hypothetical protein n=1 Tax=Haloarcula marismortui TaxID=2238 RepID=UPI003C776D59